MLEYRDGGGTRRLKTFRTKREAIDYGATAHLDIKHGTHVADADFPDKRVNWWLDNGDIQQTECVQASMKICALTDIANCFA